MCLASQNYCFKRVNISHLYFLFYLQSYQTCYKGKRWMRQGADIMHLKLLKKIKNQHLTETSKKQPRVQPRDFISTGKTPLKTPFSSQVFESISSEKSQCKIGTLKSYVIRQDYFQCMVDLLSIHNHYRPERLKFLVSREDTPVLQVGQNYEIQQIEMVELGAGTLITFAKLAQRQNKT